MHALRFAISLVLPAAMIVALVGHGAWTYFPVAFVFGVTPVLDALLGLETANPSEAEEAERLRTAWRYDLWLYLFAVLQLLLFGWTLHEVLFAARPWSEVFGLAVSFGLLAGAGGINVAHELMHRKAPLPRAVAELLMTMVSYPHFCAEHVLGHHKNVATPLDPASAHRGEVLYTFWFRTLVGSVRSAAKLEAERVARAGVRPWSLGDRRLRGPLLLAAYYLGLGLLLGPRAVGVAAGSSLVAILLLESVNYVEHYGLSRRWLGERYERVLPRHSWNSGHRLTGIYLFHLPRHADHHYLASRPYSVLRHLEDSPQLPAGYATMILCALVPPLWFKVMDPRVDAWNARRPEGLSADEPGAVADL